MRYKDLRKRYILFFSIALIFTMGFVYAILQSNLEINGTAKISDNRWDIHFENLQIDPGSVAIQSGEQAAVIAQSPPTSVSFSVSLDLPGDYYEFTVDAANQGSINASIQSVDVGLMNGGNTVSLPSYLDFSFTLLDGSEVRPGQVIKPGTSETYRVHLEYKRDIDSLPEDTLTYSYTLQLSFGQTKNNDSGNSPPKYHQLRFVEGENVDNRRGIYSYCLEKDPFDCLYYTAIGQIGTVNSLDLDNETMTIDIKTLDNNMFYVWEFPMDDGFLLTGFDLYNSKLAVAIFDSNYVKKNEYIYNMTYAITVTKTIKINNNYYILNPGVSLLNHLAVEVSSDGLSSRMVDESDLPDKATYEKIYAYNEVHRLLAEGQFVIDIVDFNGGYLLSTFSDGTVEMDSQKLFFYRNGKIEWVRDIPGLGLTNIITHNNRFYAFDEDTANYHTDIIEFSFTGEILNRTELSILNDNHRFVFSNYMLALRDHKAIFFSYLPGEDPGQFSDWSNYRIFSVEYSGDVIIPDFVGGIVSADKTDAFEGEEITLIVTPNEQYSLSSLSVLDDNNQPITLTNNRFIMPKGDVHVNASFTRNS